MSEVQCGFRNAVGTREALICIQVLFQMSRDVNYIVYARFVDKSKAFGRLQHHKLRMCLSPQAIIVIEKKKTELHPVMIADSLKGLQQL